MRQSVERENSWMLISEIEGLDFAPEYPELHGKRVLITGLAGSLGLEIARAFGEARTRLVLHTGDEGAEAVALGEIVAERALDAKLFTGPFAGHQAILEFARNAFQCFGGIDAVVNVAQVTEPAIGAGDAEIERMVTGLLSVPCLVSKVAANRMRTTLTEGAILNIVTEPRGASPRARLVAAIARSALAGLTRTEAQSAAEAGIRINAIAPAADFTERGNRVSGEPDVASLAMHLACSRGHQLSGLVFEACFA